MAVASLTEALFKLPHRSNFRMPFHVQGTYGFGKIYPLKAIEVNAGDNIKINMQSLTRSNALKYPTMANIRTEYHAFFVPTRLLAHNYENIFNLAIDENNRPSFPLITPSDYISLISAVGYSRLKSSLLDQLDYPLFAELYNFLLASSSFQDGFDKVPVASETSQTSIQFTVDFASYYENMGSLTLPTFSAWLRSHYSTATLQLINSGDYRTGTVVTVAYIRMAGSALAEILSPMLGKSTSELWSEYIDFLFEDKIFPELTSTLSDGSLRPINMMSIWSYWRCIYDWYINTNIDQNVDTWEDWCVANFGMTIDTWDPSLFADTESYFIRFITPAERLFSSDYFTSAFLSTQNGTAVPIPSGGTLIDLRSAESEQTFREKLLYSGKRLIDQVRTLFGVTSSDARFDRAEICGSQKFMININSVSQTSQSTDLDNSLGALGGQGYGSGQRNSFVKYRAEEYGHLIILMSYKPETIYAGVVDRLNLKTSAFDYLIPDFENVGEQGIYSNELAYIPASGGDSSIFGFNRRFAEYMFINSAVHGAFKTSLSFMTLARSFTQSPALNSEFIRINSSVNGLNDIFVAPEDDEQFNNWSYFEVYCTRPLSRFIEYGF